ncbi:hypothetical protein BN997_01108 [Oceanobacillus oncorhynchi]|uniref:Uncharacterized protein n=1 Tax=Oceanobacillus oncorhynchi TaxID=545501 RepID=A0A0A1M7P0_9BACI|nr:hypothetical protein [Oceanobacillus oncorhynchi]CEI81290.1 hypothetical protein BN997_01108 [Oceanobacillus oncorhynchi]
MKAKTNKMEIIWERYSFFISFLLGLFTGILYYFQLITNIRSVLSEVISFASIVVGINGVFITLVISIKTTTAFKRLIKYLPDFEDRLIKLLKSQVMVGLIVVLLSILILLLPISSNLILSSIGVVIWSFFFILMSIGSFFTMNIIMKIISANHEDPKASKRP